MLELLRKLASLDELGDELGCCLKEELGLRAPRNQQDADQLLRKEHTPERNGLRAVSTRDAIASDG